MCLDIDDAAKCATRPSPLLYNTRPRESSTTTINPHAAVSIAAAVPLQWLQWNSG
jgi:hypothetical protein